MNFNLERSSLHIAIFSILSILILILIWQILRRRFGVKRPSGHPKGGIGPLGSSDHHMMEVAPPPSRGLGGSELPKAASSTNELYLIEAHLIKHF